MRYRAHSFCFEEGTSQQVTEAIVNGDHISIDWQEGSDLGHLEAKTQDGVTFRGNFGYRHLDPKRHVQFELFRAADGRLLLLGRWWNESTGNGEEWLFRLSPES